MANFELFIKRAIGETWQLSLRSYQLGQTVGWLRNAGVLPGAVFDSPVLHNLTPIDGQ